MNKKSENKISRKKSLSARVKINRSIHI